MQQKVSVNHVFNAPVDTVFSAFSNHEQFGRMLGLKMKRVKDGDGDINGVGSVRRLNLEPLPNFEETIVKFIPNQLIEYKITKGMPLKNHLGVMQFTDQDGRTELDYTIVFESRIPYMGTVVRKAIESSVIKGLNKYAKSLS